VILNVKFGELNFGLPDHSYDCIDSAYNPITYGNPARLGLCQKTAEGFKKQFALACPTWPSATDARGCTGLDGSTITSGARGAKVSLLKSITDRTEVTYPGVKLVGPYDAVRKAIRNITYLPPDDQNSNRLRSRIDSVQSSRALKWPLTKPFEEMTMTVKFEKSECNPNGQNFPRVQVRAKRLQYYV
jgi:hypothetical protein